MAKQKKPPKPIQLDPVSETDKDLFAGMMGGVKPLQQDNVPPPYNPPAPIPRQRYLDDEQVNIDMMSDWDGAVDMQTDNEMYFKRDGIQYRVMEKLKRGDYRIQAELDLHGFRVSEARAAIASFFHDCQRRQIRAIRIIHGKGHGSPDKQPILKSKLNQWLRQHDPVLGFCSASIVDGGTGAVYVLLKNQRSHTQYDAFK